MKDHDMLKVYVYVLDTLADWEIGHVTSELKSGRFFKKNAPSITLKTVGLTQYPITTMGGMRILPDCLIEDMVIDEKSILILPGADTWHEAKHQKILEKVNTFLLTGATVCAICGATTALAQLGVLDTRPHTSNGPGFLETFVPTYKGQSFYIDKPAVSDNNLITASCTGSLLWTKLIIERLDVFEENTLKAWYNYFSTGDPNAFFALMQSLPTNVEI